jgi:hypothetical protein
MTRWMLLAAQLALVACNSSPDLCTSTVNALHKIANEVEACDPDAGFPPDTEAASEIAHCQTQIAGCDPQDLSTLNTSATCLDDLPPIQCQWLTSSTTGLPPAAAIVWIGELLSCEPAQPLSKSCDVSTGLPFDGGLPF